MISLFLKHNKKFWLSILFMAFFDLGLFFVSLSSIDIKYHESEQEILLKMSEKMTNIVDNGFFCHLGGESKENLNSEFCQDYKKDWDSLITYSVQLMNDLSEKKCKNDKLFSELKEFSNSLKTIYKNDSEKMFKFTNLNLRNAFLEESNKLRSINIKENCGWH